MSARRAAAAAFATVACLSLASPAAAEVWTVHDETGDGSNGTDDSGPRPWGDIGEVRIVHAPREVRFIVEPAPGGELADFYDFYVDTRRRNPGPEFVATISMEVLPGSGVSRATSFGDLGGPNTCSVRTATVRDGVVRVVYPRHCFDRPASIRVATQTTMEYEGADWAPARRTFSRWVARG